LLSFDCLPFDSGHAEIIVELGQRAFSAVPEYTRPKDTADHLRRILGRENPGGQTWFAMARERDRCVGTAAATPFRFRTRAGRLLTGFQLGSIAIDPSFQRQGVGSRLIAEITAYLADKPDSFTYIYPNTRSMQVLLRQGYETAAAIPTYVHLPTVAFLGIPGRAEAKFLVRDGYGGSWDVEIVTPSVLSRAMALFPEDDGGAGGFIRDAAYCRWRYCGPHTESRYQFAVLRPQTGNGGAVVVLTSHEFNGIRFTIVVDLFSASPSRHYGPAITAAQIYGSRAWARLVYSASNIPILACLRRGLKAKSWRVTVPDFANPRPIKLLLHTESSGVDRDELANGVAPAGDWMGF
jgi:GNAT superfamily N-acetyltransferase